MSPLNEVSIGAASPERFRELVGERYREVEEAITTAREILAGRAVWHVNSTARGGGVAELLQSLLAYARGAGVDVRWVTIEGNPDFFRVTKRIHNHLHGFPGDGGELGEREREIYEGTLAANADALDDMVRAGDLVYLHDPQTAGLTQQIRSRDTHVVWRCHVGLDHPNELARRAWAFLYPYVMEADAYVFSRRAFVWEGLPEERLWLVPPSIDAFSPKNQDLPADAVTGIMSTIGLGEEAGGAPVFERHDGSPGRVNRSAELDQDGPIPANAPLVAQVSRWDRLKDPEGVLKCFAEHLAHPDAHLLLAGPEVAGVADDPEGAEVLAEIRRQRDALPPELRSRVHLASLPMEDLEENAAMVNAIQRSAEVIVQKSLAEGFGLTVAEAMWKARPVVASRIGGIQDQIVDGESGLLIDDPLDLASVASAIDGLLDDPPRAEAIGTAARERVRESFLGTRHLVQYVHLIAKMLAAPRVSAG
jgi:trehalose synthase